MKPRVLLAEDDISIQDMLRFALRYHCGFDVAGEASDGITALRLCETLRPEVLLTDLRLPRLDGIGLLEQIRSRGLKVPTVFYTGTEHEEQLREAMAAHPDGFVHKHDSLDDLELALRSAMAGEVFYSVTPARLQMEPLAITPFLARLSAEERRLLRKLSDGISVEEIAADSGRSMFSVSLDREVLLEHLRKCGISDPRELHGKFPREIVAH